jgi:hypothetical protein
VSPLLIDKFLCQAHTPAFGEATSSLEDRQPPGPSLASPVSGAQEGDGKHSIRYLPTCQNVPDGALFNRTSLKTPYVERTSARAAAALVSADAMVVELRMLGELTNAACTHPCDVSFLTFERASSGGILWLVPRVLPNLQWLTSVAGPLVCSCSSEQAALGSQMAHLGTRYTILKDDGKHQSY